MAERSDRRRAGGTTRPRRRRSRSDFGAEIDGTEPSEVFLAWTDGRPFGLIQRYAIADYPEYVEELSTICPQPPGAVSIDYLIGEPDCRGRGLGAAMIAAFVAESWAAYPDASAVVVAMHQANAASWRAVERAGFRRIAEGELTPDNPVDNRDHYLYQLDRPPSGSPRRRGPGGCAARSCTERRADVSPLRTCRSGSIWVARCSW